MLLWTNQNAQAYFSFPYLAMIRWRVMRSFPYINTLL